MFHKLGPAFRHSLRHGLYIRDPQMTCLSEALRHLVVRSDVSVRYAGVASVQTATMYRNQYFRPLSTMMTDRLGNTSECRILDSGAGI